MRLCDEDTHLKIEAEIRFRIFLGPHRRRLTETQALIIRSLLWQGDQEEAKKLMIEWGLRV